MKIYINEEIDQNIWNAYAGENCFHRFEWYEIIQDAYKLRPYFAMGIEEGEFALVGSFRLGRRYISLPYAYISGFLASSLDTAKALQKELASKSIKVEYKRLIPLSNNHSSVTAIVEIEDWDAYWKSLSSNMRNQIRKSQKHGFEICEEKVVDRFYYIHSQKMHSLGTPTHSKRFFSNILRKIPNSHIFIVLLKDVPIATMLCIEGLDAVDRKQRCLYILWASTIRKYDHLYANYFLYLSVIKRFADKGITLFDLGTCAYDSSQYRFKSKWNPRFYAVQIENTLREGSSHYRTNKRLTMMSEIWKRLPYGFTCRLGPLARKYLP